MTETKMTEEEERAFTAYYTACYLNPSQLKEPTLPEIRAMTDVPVSDGAGSELMWWLIRNSYTKLTGALAYTIHAPNADPHEASGLLDGGDRPWFANLTYMYRLYPDLDWFAHVLLDAWDSGPSPLSNVTRKEWMGMFKAVGYTHDGARDESKRPTEPLTLYRGAPTKYKRRLSWTSNYEQARFFAYDYNLRQPDSVVWTAVVPPEKILAYTNMREEDEYIIDPTGLKIREMDK